MPTPTSMQQWFAGQIVPVFFVGFALLMGLLVVWLSAQQRRASLARDRWRRTENTFVHELAGYGFDPEIARATYRYLQDHQGIAFPIEPTDDLDRDLGLDADDLSQTIHDLLEATGRVNMPGTLYSPLVTVEDLVRYLQAAPRRRFRVA